MQNDKGEYKTLSKSDQALSRAKGGMDAAVGVGSSIVGLVGMVQGFRGMLKEGSVWDKAMAGEGFLGVYVLELLVELLSQLMLLQKLKVVRIKQQILLERSQRVSHRV